MKTKRSWIPQGLLALALVAFFATSAMANSNTVSYQGMLRDATLSPVADGGYAMEFSIYGVDTGGASLWGPEHYPSVATNNGRFSVYLGSILPLGTLFADHAMLWLEISADTGPGMEVYTPRVPLASVPYAQHALHAATAATATYAASAGNADTVDGQHASAFAATGHSHNLQNLGGAVTDAQVPDTITILQASNADTVDGYHASQLLVPAASTAEVQAGTVSNKYVAPTTLLGAVGFSKFFQSADYAVTAGASFDINHGLGRTPTLIQPVLKCVVADQGYAVGDLLPIYANLPHDEKSRGIRVVTTATQLQCKIGTDGQPFILFHKSAGNRVVLNYTSWRIFLRAWG